MNAYDYLIILILLSSSHILSACSNQSTEARDEEQIKNDTIMKTEEKFDFEDYKIRLHENKTRYTESDGTVINLSVYNDEPWIIKILLPPSFVIKHFFYHPDGVLKKKECFIGNDVPIGIWLEFDEQGYLIKETNENEKFDKVKPDDILRFMEKEEIINLKTGAGRFEPEGRFAFNLFYSNEEGRPLWQIEVIPFPYNAFTEIIYLIDGKTGEVLEKTSRQQLPIE